MRIIMAKRIDAVAAIENLNDIALGNQEVKARKLAAIPLPELEGNIPWTLVFPDRDFNVRDDASYSYEENKELYHSLKDLGLTVKGGDNMSFSLQPDGRYLVISGNLRIAMMNMIRNEEKEARAKAGIPTGPDSPLPFETVFGLVFSGLTRDQETDLMADHTMKKGLNEFELCKEIGETMYRLDLSEDVAAVKYGIKKSSISRLRMRYCMPTVLDEYRKEKNKSYTGSYVKVIQKALTALYTCYLADKTAGCKFREEGLQFKKAWNDYITNPDSIGKRSEPGIKSQERKDVLTIKDSLAGVFGLTPEIEAIGNVLAWAGNSEVNGSIPNVQTSILRLKEYCASLIEQRDTAYSRVESLLNEVTDLKAMNAGYVKDLDGMTQEVFELKEKLEKKTLAKNGK